MSNYVRYRPPRPLTDFLDPNGNALPGHEASGTILSYAALDALAKARTNHQPCELVAVGEHRHPDGRVFLDYAVSVEWLEATTNYRDIDGRLVWVCPECDMHNGKHSRNCPAG